MCILPIVLRCLKKVGSVRNLQDKISPHHSNKFHIILH